MQTASGNIDLVAGVVSINLEFFDILGGAGLILRWENNLGLGPEIIPAASLFHDSNMVDEDGDGTAIGTTTVEDWQIVTEFEAGVLYEINLDQDNGNRGTNNPGDAAAIPACGPRQLNSFGLEGQLTFIVANGGSTWNEFKVPDATAGARII